MLFLLIPSIAEAASFVKTSTVPTAFPASQEQLDAITSAHYRVYIGGYKNDHANVWIPDPDGDCQRKTAWMMLELRKKGVPASAMRGYVGWVKTPWMDSAQYHAWLVVAVILPNGERVNLLVDSLNKKVAYVGEIRGYSKTRPVVRLDD